MTPLRDVRIQVALVYLTALLILLQLFTGGPLIMGAAGYLTYPAIIDSIHVLLGFVTGIVVLASLIVVWVRKPRIARLGYSVSGTFVLIFLAGVFAEKSELMLLHYYMAFLAFGAAFGSGVIATRWNAGPPASSPPPQPN